MHSFSLSPYLPLPLSYKGQTKYLPHSIRESYNQTAHPQS